MKDKTCVILNAFFPYNPGETFLDNEINYYTESNLDVIVYPIHANKANNEFQYKNKENVSVIGTDNFKHNHFKIFGIIPALFQKELYQELLFLKKEKRLTVKNLVKLVRFICHGLFCANIAKKYILRNVPVNNKLIIYSYWLSLDAYIGAKMVEKLSSLYDIKFISRGHRIDIYEYADFDGYIPLRQFVFEKIDTVFPICEDGRQYLKNHYGVEDKKIIVSRLGTFDHGVNYSPVNGPLRIVSCSWARPVKRLEMIAESLKDIDIPVVWTHYGDGEELPKIRQLVDSYENKNLNVNFKGAIQNSEIMADYSKIKYDVFVNVSKSEGVPVSIMEAMSFGKIIVATDVGGTSEIVNDFENGFILPVDFEPEALKAIFKNIYSMSDNAFITMCSNSRNRWGVLSSAEKNYRDFIRML